MPWIARYVIRKTMKGFENQGQPDKRNPGDINVAFDPNKKEKLQDVGEYVDYEEIKDDKTE